MQGRILMDDEMGRSLQVDEAELPVILEFLKDIGTLSAKQGKKVRSKYSRAMFICSIDSNHADLLLGNALRQHMRSVSRESHARERGKDNVYMKPDPPTPDVIAKTESDMGTRAVGSKYVTYKRTYGDDVFHEEYVVVVLLASYILGMDFWKFHRYLSLCETQIQKTMYIMHQ